MEGTLLIVLKRLLVMTDNALVMLQLRNLDSTVATSTGFA